MTCKVTAQFRCNKQWQELAPIDGVDDARHCYACQKNVYHCDTPQALQQHSQSGHCVACPAEWIDDESTQQKSPPCELWIGEASPPYIAVELKPSK